MYQAAGWAAFALLAVLLLSLVFTLGYVSNDGAGGGSAQASTETGSENVDFSTLNQILDILHRDYFDQNQLDDQSLYEAAVRGMLESLSSTGTFYIDPESYRLSIGPGGSFEGIGATVQLLQNQIVIVQPFADGPAETAGIKAGDAILSVDGDSTEGWTVEEAVLRIRGPKGTKVTLGIRHRDGAEAEYTITRDEIKVASVTNVPPGGALRDSTGAEVTDIAYLHIAEFTENTPSEVEPLAREAQESGKKGLIIDLREDPGGLLQETVDTADLFLDSGVILSELDRDGRETFHRATPGGVALTIPIVVLMDENSASGSEVLAASLRDNGRAIIVGEKSFGKGTVNIERDLKDQGALFVTIRRWLTPKGVQIDEVGITPDVEVTPGPFDPGYDPQQDQQVFSAIDHLRGLQTTERAGALSATP